MRFVHPFACNSTTPAKTSGSQNDEDLVLRFSNSLSQLINPMGDERLAPPVGKNRLLYTRATQSFEIPPPPTTG